MIRAVTTPERQLERAQMEGWRYSGTMATEGELLNLLSALVQVHKPLVCVETGTFNGHGAGAIADALQLNDKGHLWTIENDPDIAEKYASFEVERVTFLGGDSTEWDAPDNIEFAFVDCGPPEIRIKAVENLLPKLKSGALMLVHDVAFYEVAFLEGLIKAVGYDPNIVFPALNGIAIWVIR